METEIQMYQGIGISLSGSNVFYEPLTGHLGETRFATRPLPALRMTFTSCMIACFDVELRTTPH